MKIMHPLLLSDIEAFLERHNMSSSYFGKASVGNSELVKRLRNGGRVWPDTEARARSFIMLRDKINKPKAMSSNEDSQVTAEKTA